MGVSKNSHFGEWNTEDGDTKNDMLYFYEKLEKVIEAIHIIYKQKKDL